VSVGGCYGAAIDKDGILWTWGSNTNGELGLGDFEPRPNPFPVIHVKKRKIQSISCGSSFSVALTCQTSNKLSDEKKREIAIKNEILYASNMNLRKQQIEH
jgi:alpha-tubulin suppressor-like RCC1 family protein